MDEENIYYRVKNFKMGSVQIWGLNKNSLEKKLVYKIDLKYIEALNKDCKIKYDNNNQLIYMIKKNGDKIWIKELLNNEVDVVYNKDLGEFEAYIDDRYLITSSWDEDNEENYSDTVVVQDAENGDIEEYKCAVHCYEDIVVLY